MTEGGGSGGLPPALFLQNPFAIVLRLCRGYDCPSDRREQDWRISVRRVRRRATVISCRRWAAGDANALSAFYDRHSPLVYATCVRMLGDRTTADELLVDIFQELWERAGQYDVTRANPVTFLLTLTRTRAIDRRRSTNKRSNLKLATGDQTSNKPDPSPSGLDEVIAGENVQIVRKALAALNPDQRRAIECAYYEGSESQ